MTSSISVALCTYNGERFLREQLDSITAQTLAPAELVVSDDQSTDQTLQIVQEFTRRVRFPVRIVSSATRLGVAHNFEHAIAQCHGDIIVLADQDDVWLPQKLATIAAFFDSHPRHAAIFSDAELIGDDGNPLGVRLSEAQRFANGERRRQLNRGRLLDVLFHRNICTGATMAFLRELVPLILPFPQPMPANILHDAWIALVAALHQQLGYIDKSLLLYRQHRNQELGASLPDEASLKERLGWSLEQRQHHLRNIATSSRQVCGAISERFGETEGVRQFNRYVEFIETRSHLSRQRFARLPAILPHLFNGDYSRYSSGFLAALRDMM